MSWKRRVFVGYLKLLLKMFLGRKLNKTNFNNLTVNKVETSGHLDIITIAFNNELVIEHQIRLVKKHIQDESYSHIIADNTSDKEKRKLIEAICQKEKVAYISLPTNYVMKLLPKRPSYSHGAALDWVYYNVVKLRQPKAFAFIDHDMFPTAHYNIMDKLKTQDFYGNLKDMGVGWYLWAEMCFFDFEKVKDVKLNFFPYRIQNVYLDTGGANYPALYSQYDKEKINFAKPPATEPIRDGDDYHADFIQFIDDVWLHTINASNWKKGKEKNSILKEILDEY